MQKWPLVSMKPNHRSSFVFWRFLTAVICPSRSLVTSVPSTLKILYLFNPLVISIGNFSENFLKFISLTNFIYFLIGPSTFREERKRRSEKENTGKTYNCHYYVNFFCILLNHWNACWFRKYYCPYKFCSILREKILKFSLSIIMYWLIEFQHNLHVLILTFLSFLEIFYWEIFDKI